MKTNKTILIIIALVAITTTDAFSQVQGRFRAGIDAGGFPNINNKVVGTYNIDLGYNIRDNMNIGIRGGVAIHSWRDNNFDTWSQIFNLSGTYTYFFGSGTIMPFVGGGLGFYFTNTEAGYWYRYEVLGRSSVGQIGGLLTAGVEFGRFRIAAQYNLIPATNVTLYESPRWSGSGVDVGNVRVRNSYFALTAGLYLGGGSRRVVRLEREREELRREVEALTREREIEALVQERMREMGIEGVVREGEQEREIREDVIEEHAPVSIREIAESTPTQPVIEIVSERQEIQEVQNVQVAETVHQPEIPVITAAHDVIVLRNGNIINAHVAEITLTEIRYRAAENPHGPIITLAKRDVFSIDFANGTRQIISAPTRQGRPQHDSFQQGDFAIGGHLAIFPESGVPTFGIGAKIRYNITDPIRLEGAFTYVLPMTVRYMGVDVALSMWNFSANMHYLFAVSENVTLYPLVGFSVLGIVARASAGGQSVRNSGTFVCFNLGGGIDIKLNNRIALNVEPKLLLNQMDNVLGVSFMPSAGIMYRF